MIGHAACRVLVVEDDENVRQVLIRLIGRAGYSVQGAADGREALTAMRILRPTVVLLDIQMPVMDGFEFRRQQLLEPTLASIPIICLTGAHDPERIAFELKAHCLAKPLDLDKLLQEVATVCDRVAAENDTPT
jgi:CheY-like chemotaxis protein